MAANLAIKYNSSIRLVGWLVLQNRQMLFTYWVLCPSAHLIYAFCIHIMLMHITIIRTYLKRARARSPQTKQQGNEIKSESITVNTLMHSCIQNTCVSAAFFRSWPWLKWQLFDVRRQSISFVTWKQLPSLCQTEEAVEWIKICFILRRICVYFRLSGFIFTHTPNRDIV